ncbi:unnamed protein product, partial [Mycena citricolor]
ASYKRAPRGASEHQSSLYFFHSCSSPAHFSSSLPSHSVRSKLHLPLRRCLPASPSVGVDSTTAARARLTRRPAVLPNSMNAPSTGSGPRSARHVPPAFRSASPLRNVWAMRRNATIVPYH